MNGNNETKPPAVAIGKPPLSSREIGMPVEQAFAEERREKRKAYLREYSAQWRRKHPAYWKTPAARDRQARWRAAKKRKQSLLKECMEAVRQMMTALVYNDFVMYHAALARYLDVTQVLQDDFREATKEVEKPVVAMPVAFVTEEAGEQWKESLDERFKGLEGEERLDEFRTVVRMYLRQQAKKDPRADWTFEWLEVAFDDMVERGLFSKTSSLVEEIGYVREAMER